MYSHIKIKVTTQSEREYQKHVSTDELIHLSGSSFVKTIEVIDWNRNNNQNQYKEVA